MAAIPNYSPFKTWMPQYLDKKNKKYTVSPRPCSPVFLVRIRLQGVFAHFCICFLSCCLFASISQIYRINKFKVTAQASGFHCNGTEYSWTQKKHEIFFLLPTLRLCDHLWLRQHRGLLVYIDVRVFLQTPS